jgi:enoyl-CoA hydratase
MNCEGDVSDELLVTTDGAVRIVTINRPDDPNVVNASLHHRLLDVWRDLERDRGGSRRIRRDPYPRGVR